MILGGQTMYTSQFRLKDDTAKKLKFIAKASCRSMNQQLEHIILQFISDYEKVNGKIDQSKIENED